ncbi:hypothetical protein [Pseudomonas protegens]|uniref:hypothetical protein n=1 Tax=Pseudomonas protegens TaxID=380021 RepID=UPI001CDB3A2F|nr:hypothetical protein [Pseudomonas protegens]
MQAPALAHHRGGKPGGIEPCRAAIDACHGNACATVGVYKLAPGASSVNTSCSANLAIAKWAGFPNTSNGNATLNCRGYNAGAAGGTLGCKIEWTGPTQVAIGVTPYGGQVAVNFNCQALYFGSVGTVMDFSYADPTYPRIRYGSVQATSSMTITQ